MAQESYRLFWHTVYGISTTEQMDHNLGQCRKRVSRFSDTGFLILPEVEDTSSYSAMELQNRLYDFLTASLFDV